MQEVSQYLLHSSHVDVKHQVNVFYLGPTVFFYRFISKWLLLLRGLGILVPFCIFTIGVCFLSVWPKFGHP